MKWSSLIPVAAAVAFSGLFSCQPARADGEIALVRVPNEGIQPQVAIDASGTIHLVYYEGAAGAGDIYYVKKGSGDAAFSSPLRINSQPASAIAAGSIRGAQIALGKEGRLHVAWNGSNKAEPKGPVKYGNPMLYSRLDDDRTAFEPQRNVIDEAYGLDGGGSVAADPEGNVYVAWHAGANEANRRVWLVRSSDEGATFSKEAAVDGEQLGACGCCGMKAFSDRAGSVYLLYRSARQNVNRDMQLLVSESNGRSFLGQQLDKWMIATCPMSSEAFAEGPGGVYAAWETNGQVSLAHIRKDGTVVGKPRHPSGAGKGRKHPTIAVNRTGHVLLAWAEGTGWEKGGSLAWQEFDADGKPTKVRGRRDGIPVWSFPAAYAEPDGTFVIVY